MVSLLIVGAGSRGGTFAGWARRHPAAARVVAVAEPREARADTGAGIPCGHGGGDDGVMAAFVAAVAAEDPGLVPTSPADTLASHRIGFAAEAARRERRVVTLADEAAERREHVDAGG
jgi:hypothetical protein